MSEYFLWLLCTILSSPGSYLVSAPPGMKSPHRMLDPDVLAVEQENQRLEEEIFRIQLAREKNKREHGITVSLGI